MRNAVKNVLVSMLLSLLSKLISNPDLSKILSTLKTLSRGTFSQGKLSKNQIGRVVTGIELISFLFFECFHVGPVKNWTHY